MDDLDFMFDDLLFQIIVGKMQYSDLEKGIKYYQKQQLPRWQLKFGFKFNIYCNDHLIEGKPHFHFDNKEQKIYCKMDFDGNVLESLGNRLIPSRVQKELKYFLSKKENKENLIQMWNEKNPTLKI